MGKAARTKAAARFNPGKPAKRRVPSWHEPARWISVGVVVLIAVAALVVWRSGQGGTSAQPVVLTHIHGLSVNPADGELYVATHDGLYQLPADGGAAQLVGQSRQDTMGFTIAAPNHFLASGHPAPGQSGPGHLGLIESSDGGLTWTTRSLPGQADFHALRYRHNTVYGYNSVSGQLMASTDKVIWQTRASMRMRDFDVSPTDTNTLLATTETGLQRSVDGGTTWGLTGGPPVALLAWEADNRLWGITTTGDILRSADDGTTWDSSGRLAGQATAFAAQDGALYASIHGQGIHRSNDGGATWTQIYHQGD